MIIWIGDVQDVLSGEVEESAFGWTAFRIIGDDYHLHIFDIRLIGENLNHGETGGRVGYNATLLRKPKAASSLRSKSVPSPPSIFLVDRIVNQDIVSISRLPVTL
jgi:hypothetical protein